MTMQPDGQRFLSGADPRSSLTIGFDELYHVIDSRVGFGKIRLAPGEPGRLARVCYECSALSVNIDIDFIWSDNHGELLLEKQIIRLWSAMGSLVWAVGLLRTLRTAGKFSGFTVPEWISEPDSSHLLIDTRKIGPWFPTLSIHGLSVDHHQRTITIDFITIQES